MLCEPAATRRPACVCVWARRARVCVCVGSWIIRARPNGFRNNAVGLAGSRGLYKIGQWRPGDGSSAARTPCSPRCVHTTVLPTDRYTHVHLPGIYICAFFFFLIFLAFLPLRRYVRTFSNGTTHYNCLPVASFRQKQQNIIADVPLSRVVRFFRSRDTAVFARFRHRDNTIVLYRLLYHCCCFSYVFPYLCVHTTNTRHLKSYDLLVRTTHIPPVRLGGKKTHRNLRFSRLFTARWLLVQHNGL